MDVGIQFFPTASSQDRTAQEYWSDALYLSELAETLGFRSIRTVEHYFHPYGGYSPNPMIFLSAAAMKTSNIRLITGAIIPAFGHPLKLASDIGMLDAICGGRLEVGFARAFLPLEFERFGVSLDESRERFEEGVEQIRRLLEEECVSCEGKFHSFKNVTSLPRPLQRPRPPFFVAATNTPESFRRAGQLGYNLMSTPLVGGRMTELIHEYHDGWTAKGNCGRGRVMLAFHMLCAPTDHEALDIARNSINQYISTMVDAAAEWNTGISSLDYPGYSDIMKRLSQESFETMVDSGRALVGCPERLTRQISEYSNLMGGFDEVSLQVNFGSIRRCDAEASMRLFASQVVPHIEDL